MRAAYIVVGTVLIVALLAAVSLAFVARGSAAPSTPRIDVPAEAVAGLVTIRFSSHERGVPTSRLRYRCSVDSSAVAPCRSPHAVRLAAGAHSFRVQAVDPRGRRSAFAHVSIHLQALAPSVKVGVAPVALTSGANALWTADYGAGTVTRIEGGRVKARIDVGGSPGGIAVAGGSVWVSDFEPNGRLTRIDPSSNRVTDRIDLGGQPAGLLAAGNVLWVADYSGFVERIDATT